ncbi:MAG: carbohydrate porin [Candidatus Entotheonellia bacterium]
MKHALTGKPYLSRSQVRRCTVTMLLSLMVLSPHAAASESITQANQRYPVLREFRRIFAAELQQPYMTGTWGGLRERLVTAGVTPTITYTADVLGNPVGGQRRALTYSGGLNVDMQLDLEKIWGLAGAVLDISGAWGSGASLTVENFGATFSASQISSNNAIRLYALAFEQSLFDRRFDIRLGRFGAGDDFLTSPLYTPFVSGAFDGSPGSVGINVPSFTSFPIATWGLRTRVKPLEDFYVMGGVYYSDTSLGREQAHGLDFSIRDEAGVFVIGEIGYRHNQRRETTGLPGNYKLGGYYDSNAYPELGGAAQAHVRGNYGVYVLVDQQVYREGPADSAQGLTPFATVTYAPSDRNTFPLFCSTGLVYQGLLPGRDRDTTAFGLAYGRFSRHLPRQAFEMVLEWTYEIALAPWLTVQPDMQYIVRPGGTGDIPNVWVIGVQLGLNF